MIPPPPRSGGGGAPPPPPTTTSHAVDRSSEFLSAARTALKIAQQRRRRRREELAAGAGGGAPDRRDDADGAALPEWMADLDPRDLRLHQPRVHRRHRRDDDDDDGTSAAALLADSRSLLSLLDVHLSDLSSLVRRRGHTNDPTLEIQSILERFQEGAKEVREACDALRSAGNRPCDDGTRSSSQRRRHYELVSSQLEGMAGERTERLKGELETRSKVLKDQSRRRKLLAGGGGAGVGGAAGAGAAAAVPARTTAHLPSRTKGINAASQFQSPLFTATSGGRSAAPAAARNGTAPSSSGRSGYAGYGGATAPVSNGSNYAGYGGTTSAPPSFGSGMRHRKQQPQPQQPKSNVQVDAGDDDDKYGKDGDGGSVRAQVALRRQRRDVRARAHQARLAERSVAELGVMFAKMSSLISQQGEVLERIEDDVEAAGGDVDAGHDELAKVYGMTRGNRGLILKVFGILIFLIVFMKLY
ncbi:hypothetical protein ACHAWF_012342 [Thalassiosira exigua]